MITSALQPQSIYKESTRIFRTLLTYELTDYYPYPITIMPVCILCNLVVFNWKYITFKHLEIRQQARYT